MDTQSIKVSKKAMKKRKSKKAAAKFSSFKLFWTSMLYQVKEFFNNSTLHGVRYIAETGRPFGEKFMWFCFVAIGAVAAFIIIVSLWEKFQTNPTITGLDTDFHNQQVFFPTVIVCPSEPYEEAQVKKVAEEQLGHHESDFEKFIPFLQALTRLSYDNMADAYAASSNVTKETSLEGKELRQLMFSVAIKCEETFAWCRYKDDGINCCDFFLPVYSEHGFCFGFNSRYTDTERAEEKFADLNDLFETDKKWALTFDLTLQSKIFVHSFEENIGFDFRPQMTWDVNYAADLLISMKHTYTTEDARQLSIGQRKCIFANEVKLQYYVQDKYTFTGCMKECRMKKSLKFCNCLPPFYRPKGVTKYCMVKDMECLAKHLSNITEIRGCGHCELSCDNTVYDIEKFSKTMKSDSSKEDESYVNIEYLTWPIIRYKREVLFGWVDLLVSFGGIAGLFLGFSLLSGVEIIYYFTMRAFCMLYKNRDELYKIEEEKLLRPPVKYNLSLTPKLEVRPLTTDMNQRSANTPTLNIITEHEILNDAEIDRLKRFRKFDTTNHKLKNFARPNQFKPIQVAPYSQYIKPLDQKFHANSDEPFFYGYLP